MSNRRCSLHGQVAIPIKKTSLKKYYRSSLIRPCSFLDIPLSSFLALMAAAATPSPSTTSPWLGLVEISMAIHDGAGFKRGSQCEEAAKYLWWSAESYINILGVWSSLWEVEERQTVEVVRSLEGQNCSTTPAMRKVSGGVDMTAVVVVVPKLVRLVWRWKMRIVGTDEWLWLRLDKYPVRLSHRQCFPSTLFW